MSHSQCFPVSPTYFLLAAASAPLGSPTCTRPVRVGVRARVSLVQAAALSVAASARSIAATAGWAPTRPSASVCSFLWRSSAFSSSKGAPPTTISSSMIRQKSHTHFSFFVTRRHVARHVTHARLPIDQTRCIFILDEQPGDEGPGRETPGRVPSRVPAPMMAPSPMASLDAESESRPLKREEHVPLRQDKWRLEDALTHSSFWLTQM